MVGLKSTCHKFESTEQGASLEGLIQEEPFQVWTAPLGSSPDKNHQARRKMSFFCSLGLLSGAELIHSIAAVADSFTDRASISRRPSHTSGLGPDWDFGGTQPRGLNNYWVLNCYFEISRFNTFTPTYTPHPISSVLENPNSQGFVSIAWEIGLFSDGNGKAVPGQVTSNGEAIEMTVLKNGFGRSMRLAF